MLLLVAVGVDSEPVEKLGAELVKKLDVGLVLHRLLQLELPTALPSTFKTDVAETAEVPSEIAMLLVSLGECIRIFQTPR